MAKATTKVVREIVEEEEDSPTKKIIVTLYGSTTAKNEKQFSSNVQHMTYGFLMNDVTSHCLVPRHELLLANEAEEVLKKFASPASQFPILLGSDAVVQFLGFEEGDIVKIHRRSFGGLTEATPFYRLVSAVI